jgi:hypothetical protein
MDRPPDRSRLIELALRLEKLEAEVVSIKNQVLLEAGAPVKRKPVKEFRTGDKVTKIKRK